MPTSSHQASSSNRHERVAEMMQRELALLLHHGVKDPRLQHLTIVDVEVTNDLSFAKVYFTTLDAEALPEIQKALIKASGFLRSHIGKQLKLRLVPELKFIYDASIERGQKLSELIEHALSEDEKLKREDEN